LARFDDNVPFKVNEGGREGSWRDAAEKITTLSSLQSCSGTSFSPIEPLGEDVVYSASVQQNRFLMITTTDHCVQPVTDGWFFGLLVLFGDFVWL